MQISNYVSVANVRQLHEQYETHLSALAVTAGFIVDSLTLRRIDLWAENMVILIFLLTAASAIILMQLYKEGILAEISILGFRPFAHADWWLPLVMQFAFGGLFSVFLVFYGRSGAILANWPFFVLLVGLLVGNELFRRRYRQLYFNTLILFLAVFAYLIFAVPIVLNQIGLLMFLISGVLALAFIWVFLRLFVWILPKERIGPHVRWVWGGAGILFALMTLMYVTHLIPPIPLSLTETQVAYNVQRIETNKYQLAVADTPWYRDVFSDTTIKRTAGQPVYFYSAIFAPTDFHKRVVHHWQYQENGIWKSASRIDYSIVGGRDGGYRGYSLKRNVFPGRWRVTVETGAGRVIGRQTFTIRSAMTQPRVQTVIKQKTRQH